MAESNLPTTPSGSAFPNGYLECMAALLMVVSLATALSLRLAWLLAELPNRFASSIGGPTQPGF